MYIKYRYVIDMKQKEIKYIENVWSLSFIKKKRHRNYYNMKKNVNKIFDQWTNIILLRRILIIKIIINN